MKTKLLYLFTRTPLHVGAGSSVGAVDQPVMRERHTGFPIIPGSSIKGVLRDHNKTPKEGDTVFGREASKDDSGHVGELSFSEAKLLLFPVRSAKGAFALATCPHALGRLKRDVGIQTELPSPPETGYCLAGSYVALKQSEKEGVVLEEYAFEKAGNFPAEWSQIITGLLDDPTLKDGAGRLVCLSDDDFAHFAQNACQVLQHNRINPETGTVDDGALFNEEVVPSETLFYSQIHQGSNKEEVTNFLSKLEDEQLLQFGGKSTTGLGFCTIKLNKENA